ncbi:PspC domain-containing protein [Aliiglaciecola sp. LCG003]|uniref:PspC domain-containing protein n=1 Tax=Aliiglaciecola sp. LCG003 TaxID=3053655 RepID=UPI00257389EE|nr:PspC domain-containing protein [Aliiglaciecola sp. LCG003]WJG11006.1 PspC domain-containing protein [Aliiglaciecola sp. LCG003]
MQVEKQSAILTRGDSQLFAGVCSGLADYYGLRKNGVRAAFFIMSMLFILPIILYLVLWLILPKYPSSVASRRQLIRTMKNRQSRGC